MADEIGGHIVGGPADPDYAGATLTADLGAGDTALHVDDVGDFDEDAALMGGQVILGVELDDDGELDLSTATVLAYDTCDDDAGTVTLSAASPVTASTGDRVYVADVIGLPVLDLEVMVQPDGAELGDALPAILPHSLISTLGDVDLTGQAVELDEDDDDQLRVTGLPGLARAQGGVKAMQDSMVVAATGTQTLRLTYRPIKNSEHLYLNGLYQPGSEWSRDAWTVTAPDAAGIVEVGDELVMEYLYTDPALRPTLEPSVVLVGVTEVGNTATTVALPVGTEAGDLLVLAMTTGNLAGTVPSCSDSRMPTHYVVNHCFVGYGLADSSGSPIAVAVSDGEHNGGIVLAAYRVIGALSAVHSTGTTPLAPTMPGGTPGAAVMVLAYESTGATASPHDGWTTDAEAVGTSVRSEVWSAPGDPAFTTPIDGSWNAIVIGALPL